MKVLVPKYQDALFIDEVIKSYTSTCQVVTSFETFWLNQGSYDIIHLHWPEYLFKWEVPTDTELLFLERVLTEWQQKGTKIVVTRHNYLPHGPNPKRYVPLYNLVYANVDAVIHMGTYSEVDYLERYKSHIPKWQVQAQIPHPIFTNYPNTINKEAARKQLQIKQNTTVMLVFGEVRKAVEKNLVLKAFDAIEDKNKLLLAPGWKFSKTKEPINRLKWLKVKLSKKYRITQEFIPNDMVQYYFKAANFVFLPRTDTLNSGVPFLAAVFNTPMVGCQTGNITEILKANGMPCFNVEKFEQIKIAINQALLNKEDISNYTLIKRDNQAKAIGKKHIELFSYLIK